jgi:catechol 2,3-dioxygenase-like lactoylglutathione lyase family enzyme
MHRTGTERNFMTRHHSSTHFAPARLVHAAVVLLAASLPALAPAQTPPAAPAAAAAPATLPPLLGIAHIAIRVKDIATSLAFYHKLGFDQAFANTSPAGVVTQSFVKINDRQYIELYPVSPRDASVEFLHLCFEGGDLNGIHDFYVAEGLTPITVRKAAAGNLLFTVPGPMQFATPQNIEYTEYMPGSRHTLDFGQHLSPDRVATSMSVVVLAMQDPAAARDFYLTKLGFTADPGHPTRLNLIGTSGQQIDIVPVDALGSRSSILLESPDLDKAAAQLTRQQVDFKRAAASETDGTGKTHTVDMLSVTDPDNNIIRIEHKK